MNNDVRREALEHLTATDAALVTVKGRRRSLDPKRTWATSLRALGDALLDPSQPAGFAEALATTLSEVARAQLRNFPHNIFWDLDGLAGELVRGALATDDSAGALARRGALVVALHDQYGLAGPIRFRYAHDFIYGWDWAKWVARDPKTRAELGPFDEPVLLALGARGQELVDLIERGDERYPALLPHEMRNPFGFSREPEDEAFLMTNLAAHSKVPVETWRLDPRPIWNRPYARLRREEAEQLGLAYGRRPVGED